MGIFGWILTGLIAGSLAQRFTGIERKGCLRTMLLGIAGGLVSGFIASAIFGRKTEIDHFGWRSIGFALVGSMIVCFVAGPLLGRKR
jgi:uncharacterized membrane protein YeaQ/YmgE (transglycosylase-associated protein family)